MKLAAWGILHPRDQQMLLPGESSFSASHWPGRPGQALGDGSKLGLPGGTAVDRWAFTWKVFWLPEPHRREQRTVLEREHAALGEQKRVQRLAGLGWEVEVCEPVKT